MTLWQKLVAACKFTFGGFESASDYVLGIVNGWMADKGYAQHIRDISAKAAVVLDWLDAHAHYCPTPWCDCFESVMHAVRIIAVAGADGELCRAEIIEIVEAWRDAYADWQKE